MSRPAQIRFLSRTASLYDPVVRALGFGRLWEALAERLNAAEGTRVLDACTGTGGSALALARRGYRVVGFDLAAGMLERARRRARDGGLDRRVRWLRMDARQVAFPDGAFPVVTCTMALHEMAEAERERVLRELRRVARDRVLVADYRVPAGVWGGALFRLSRAFEYLESDDFGGYLARDFRARLEAAGLRVDAPFDAGAYRVWPCRVARR
jgi:ubiquinone/menaquinone biosynthesis C-methylase UbiE